MWWKFILTQIWYRFLIKIILSNMVKVFAINKWVACLSAKVKFHKSITLRLVQKIANSCFTFYKSLLAHFNSGKLVRRLHSKNLAYTIHTYTNTHTHTHTHLHKHTHTNTHSYNTHTLTHFTYSWQNKNRLIPNVNFINILCVLFCQYFGAKKISNPKHSFVIFGPKIWYKKCARKMLMKLTPYVH